MRSTGPQDCCRARTQGPLLAQRRSGHHCSCLKQGGVKRELHRNLGRERILTNRQFPGPKEPCGPRQTVTASLVKWSVVTPAVLDINTATQDINKKSHSLTPDCPDMQSIITASADSQAPVIRLDSRSRTSRTFSVAAAPSMGSYQSIRRRRRSQGGGGDMERMMKRENKSGE